MTLQTTFKDNWLEKLINLKNELFKGQFFIKSYATSWNFQVSLGWIFYATRGSTQTLQRRLLLYCPQLEKEPLLDKILSYSTKTSDSWEYRFLFKLVESRDVTKQQAEQIMLLSVLEALYEVLDVVNQVESYQIESHLSDPPLITFDPEKLLAEIREFSQIWQGAKISGSSFNLAPIVKKPIPWEQLSTKQEKLALLADGCHTFWDIQRIPSL